MISCTRLKKTFDRYTFLILQKSAASLILTVELGDDRYPDDTSEYCSCQVYLHLQQAQKHHWNHAAQWMTRNSKHIHAQKLCCSSQNVCKGHKLLFRDVAQSSSCHGNWHYGVIYRDFMICRAVMISRWLD